MLGTTNIDNEGILLYLYHTVNLLRITLTKCELVCPIIKPVIKLAKSRKIMDTINTQQAEQAIKRFKQWVKAFETAQELFPELESKQWLTLADCLDEAINNR